MKIKNYFTIGIAVFLVFMFLYTFKINLDLEQKLNIANLGMIIGIFILWLVGGYLFLVKDIINSTERERNGLILVFVLLGIIFFYYNPLPKPENYFLDLPRITYFALTLVIFALSISLAWKQKSLGLVLAVFIPFSSQSYLVNILEITKYTPYTFYIILGCIALVSAINYLRDSKKIR